LSNDKLLNEAAMLIAKSRLTLQLIAEDIDTIKPTSTQRRSTIMSTELTAQRAGELYASGQSVIEVAREYSMTYAQVRKLIGASGTPIRSASDRLKGRTRKAERA
jgi:parvulin-like peptidyl-prolyl isomerase